MILSMSDQFNKFIIAVAMGVVSGALFDITRVVRMIFKLHPDFLVRLEDVLYWLAVSFGMMQLILNFNGGELRWFLIAGLASGMAFYFAAISDFVVGVMRGLIGIIEKVVQTAIDAVTYPVKLLIKILTPPVKSLINSAKNAVKKIFSLFTKIRLYARIKLMKSKKNFKIATRKI
jgi:spore cortex biosynthesis protein YabQ